MTASQHTIAGTVLTMPVQIRKATQHMAMFSVDADAAQQMIDYSGLQVCRYLPGRAIVVLMLMHYIDGDLGQYYEFGTSVMVNPPGSTASGPRALQSAGAFIHHLPVDQPFTLEAGTKIWGYPKVMADFTIREGRRFGFDVQHRRATGGRHGISAVACRFRSTPRTAERSARYSHRDGVTRETAFEHTLDGVRTRFGGCTRPVGRSPLRERAGVAGASEARACCPAQLRTYR